VVKNPAHGSANGGPVSLEVPWREGTRVRTARREDLIRLLVTALDLPTFEVLAASASLKSFPATDKEPAKSLWSVSLELYITPRSTNILVLPHHRATLELRIEGKKPRQMEDLRLFPPYSHSSSGSRLDSETITGTSSEVIINGPGRVFAQGVFREPGDSVLTDPPSVSLHLRLVAADDDRPMEVSASLVPVAPAKHSDGSIESWRWNLTGGRLGKRR
jgi:hypothetical protein